MSITPFQPESSQLAIGGASSTHLLRTQQKLHKSSLVYQIIPLVTNNEWLWILEFIEGQASSFRNILNQL
mgnify:CR=1 FL=1